MADVLISQVIKIPENVVWSPNCCSFLGIRGRGVWWRCQNFNRKFRNSSFCMHVPWKYGRITVHQSPKYMCTCQEVDTPIPQTVICRQRSFPGCVWNSLPSEVTSAQSLHSFRRHLKTLLF